MVQKLKGIDFILKKKSVLVGHSIRILVSLFIPFFILRLVLDGV